MSNTQNIAKAERLLRYLEKDPNNLPLRYDVIAATVEAENWSAANDVAQIGIEKYPEELDMHCYLGLIKLQQLDYEAAALCLNFAIDAGSQNLLARYNYAFSLFMLERYQQCYSALTHIVINDKVDPPVRMLLAHCLYQLSQHSKAIDEVRIYIKANPRRADAHGLLALLLCEAEQYEISAIHAQSALAIDALQIDALLAVAGKELGSVHYGKAIDAYQQVLRVYPECGRAHSGKGLANFAMNKFDEAQQDFEKAVQYMPNHIGTWHLLAWVHLLEGRSSEAKNAFMASYKLDRNFSETHGGFAVVAVMQGKINDALRHIKIATRLNQTSMSAQYASLLLAKINGNISEVNTILANALDAKIIGKNTKYKDLLKQNKV